MSLYKRGNVWWFKFRFAGRLFCESAKTSSKTVARDAERVRRRELEEGYNGLKKSDRAQTFDTAADAWLEFKSSHVSPSTITIEKLNLKHLRPEFGSQLICDINADDVSRYQKSRLAEQASPKTVNLEVGTLRAILKRHRLWGNLQPDVKMLRTRDDIGRALSAAEEKKLLDECRKSRSRSLYPAIELALNTCMRFSEIRLLRWAQINLDAGELRVGKSKTEAGDGRVIPLNGRIKTVLSFWAGLFPERTPDHFVFPSEQYGGGGKKHQLGFTGGFVYDTDPSKPIGDWKEAWEAAKSRAGITCRFHDLRHTGCTRLLEAGVPFSVVAEVMGWSASTAIRMAKRYGHIGQAARRDAMDKLSSATEFDVDGVQNWVQAQVRTDGMVQ